MTGKKVEWKQVAHLYHESKITVVSWLNFKAQFTGIWYANSYGRYCLGMRGVMKNGGEIIWAWNQHKPILIHLQDITERHARKLAVLGGWEDYRRSDENYPIQSFFVADNVLYISQSKNDTQVDFSKLSPAQFLFLLSCGYDLFNLIKTGEAIRKKVAKR